MHVSARSPAPGEGEMCFLRALLPRDRGRKGVDATGVAAVLSHAHCGPKVAVSLILCMGQDGGLYCCCCFEGGGG